MPEAMKTLAVLILGLSLSACASASLPGSEAEPAPPRPQPEVADTLNARLADATARELAHLSRFDPDALDTVQDELRVLAAALAGRAVRPNEDAVAMAAQEAPPPPPDLADARSVFHAVHLASYRGPETAAAGWRTLHAMFPDVLDGLSARLESVEIEGRGEFLRLKAGPFDTRNEARAACNAIEAAGAYCALSDFTGEPFPQ
jgi:hypothetical protein